MNKKDVTEIKRRLKKESCTISRISGCYVDSGKNKVLTFSKSFLNLEDEEFYKYLDIANKVLSGKLLNNLLLLDFPSDAEEAGGAQASLLALRNSELKDENLLDAFYDKVIDTYETVENYLILLFHDTYDIPMKTTDEFSLGDSEEVYEYVICALCPVALAKPGLSYHEEENTIAALQRSWIVGAPDTGFTFPAFSERSSNIHSVLAYCKNAKEPHKEFFENCLACPSKLTSTEKKKAFTDMMKNAIGPESDDTTDILTDVQQSLAVFIEEEEENKGATNKADAEKFSDALINIMMQNQIDIVLIGYTLLNHIDDPCIYYMIDAIKMAKEKLRDRMKPIFILSFMSNTRNQEALEKLHQFDDEWWIENEPLADNKLCIDVVFI